jgi:hypothetical protein
MTIISMNELFLVFMIAYLILVIPTAGDAKDDPGGAWNAPDRGAKVSALIPGKQVPAYTPDTLFNEWTKQQTERWNKEHAPMSEEEAYRKYASMSPSDTDLTSDFPVNISPFGKLRSGNVDKEKADQVMITYCPFCEIRMQLTPFMSMKFDPENPYRHATTSCCHTDLYASAQDCPSDYAMKPTETASFLHLDGKTHAVPVTIYRDKNGAEWELYIKTIFDQKRWIDQGCNLVSVYCEKFKETADPFYVHKMAAILDVASDTYYGLPLAYENDVCKGKDGKTLTRAEWEAVPRPAIFEISYLGPWNKREPMNGSKGWLNMLKEHIWVEPFARVRHHPAFKYYSLKKYGDPDALDRKIMTKMMRELSLMFQSVFSQKLLHNYQDANYVDLWLLGVLLQDKVLLDFAAPTMELTMYNHTYHDGLNGEGAPNYMAMPMYYYIPFLKDPKGWLQYQPDFLKNNPFYWSASSEPFKLATVRNIDFEHTVEFGDSHIMAYREPSTDPAVVAKQEKAGSRNWAGYGVGILRVGGPGHRQEICITYPRATLHSSQDALGIECWVDGIPVMRRGGYSAWWDNLQIDWNRPEYQVLRKLGYPHEMEIGKQSFSDWTWKYPHSAMCQNTATVDDVGTGLGWADNRGYGEVITYKGGESVGESGSGFQVLDVRDHYSWERVNKQVKDFRRVLIGVEGPDGRPYTVDIFHIAGGKKHTLFNSAWADRGDDMLPSVKGKSADLGAYFYGSKLPKENEDAQQLPLVRHIEELSAAQGVWNLVWKTDYAAYAPRSIDGKPFKRPLPDNIGKVQVRLLGLPQDDGQTKLLRGKGPWNAIVRQELPNAPMFNSNVAFMDARDFLLETRSAKDAKKPLESLFVHVIEGFKDGEQSVIKSMTQLKPVSLKGSERQLIAVRLSLAAGHTDTVIYQSSPGELRLPNGIQTDARYALIRQDKSGVVIGVDACRGTYIKSGKFKKTFSRDFSGTIVDVIGDISGTRQESALVIKPRRPWPAGTQLKGKQLLARVTSPLRNPCNEGYNIEKVTTLPDGLIRADLQDSAPFITSWHEVIVLPDGQPNVIKTNRPMADYNNTPWYRGLKIWFPQKGKTYRIKRTNELGGGVGGDTLELDGKVDLRKDGITVGDWYVIYCIEPGLKVDVAGDFSWRL